MSHTDTLSLDALCAAHCRHMNPEDGMSAEAVAAQLAVLPEWRHEAGALRRTYAFENYYQSLAFVNAIAWIIHREDHHPELTLTYNRVAIAFDTHSANGISLNDFICAARLDRLYAG